jgi:hypothetical protein
MLLTSWKIHKNATHFKTTKKYTKMLPISRPLKNTQNAFMFNFLGYKRFHVFIKIHLCMTTISSYRCGSKILGLSSYLQFGQ